MIRWIETPFLERHRCEKSTLGVLDTRRRRVTPCGREAIRMLSQGVSDRAIGERFGCDRAVVKAFRNLPMVRSHLNRLQDLMDIEMARATAYANMIMILARKGALSGIVKRHGRSDRVARYPLGDIDDLQHGSYTTVRTVRSDRRDVDVRTSDG